ncbi:MAG TPA: bifunctional serine/threonine-protein kinase/formylglycine-generating enzyme family protein [Myxococcota bacterium]|nr:bifunctional serine/threonine-protein kinase/formylglycine-generating enzyme family protein [Myxococcota bacterium]HOD00120.1 bifunctional serine/threonine-protein kinase/formylglycine-generating enzyme family protein [Myxococcota bacterium]HOH77198.1 bifunctional serine/threonine-protein kinase/formylglycine-generating enzyme family protein [Myxococcota bacterium]
MGSSVREWELLDEIGRGGMGIVYRARHQILPGEWAIKVIRPELSQDRELRQRFLSEIMVLKALRHPNIIEIETPFEESGQLFMPMEFLSGESLEVLCQQHQGPWEPATAINIIGQAAAGLGYAHQRTPQVLHRDVKPANIQVLSDGRIKVLDFGLARTIGDRSLTGTGMGVGTPAYMSPEVLEGRRATPQSDVFSLGVVLFRLLAGRLPHDMPPEDATLHAVLLAVARSIERGIRDVRTFVPGIPDQLADITMNTLAVDPATRPADCAELSRMLQSLTSAPDPSSFTGREFSADSTHIGIDLGSIRGKASTGSIAPGQATSAPAVRPLNPPVRTDRQPRPSPSPLPRPSPSPGPEVRDAMINTPRPAGTSRTPLFVAIGMAVAVLIGILAFLAIDRSTGSGNDSTTGRHETGKTSVTASSGQRSSEPESPSSGAAPSEGSGSTGSTSRAGGASDSARPMIDWVPIEGGSFMMGNDSGQADERPVHHVTVPSFQIARTEVTVRQYMKCVSGGVCTMPHWDDGSCRVFNGADWPAAVLPEYMRGLDQPVLCVDYSQAATFSAWVGGRLPSEAEWEFAARSRGANTTWPWGTTHPNCNLAVMDYGARGCGTSRTLDVCSRTAGNSAQGVCDLIGNAWEIVADNYNATYNGVPSDGSAYQNSARRFRVVRGGSWFDPAGITLRSTDRFSVSGTYKSSAMGFRPVR